MATRINLSRLVVTERYMREVVESGRVSDTPDVPIFVCPRTDGAGLEICDGLHRVAAAIRRGEASILADIADGPDDEPYLPPFYPF